MITLTREEAQELLNALTMFCRPNEDQVDELVYEGAIDLLRARLSAPELEPVAWLFQHEETGLTDCIDTQQVEWGFEKNNRRWQKIAPLYTAPSQREWQGLTDEDRQELAAEQYGWEGLCSAVEAKLREKNCAPNI